jgi:3',5'-cyclic AMP phosphodiesterase CpdA
MRTRRDFLAGSLAAVAAASADTRGHANPPPLRQRQLRIAHLTDIHIQPELAAARGLFACLEHVQALPDRPDLIVTGGDTIMDGFSADFARTKLQWELWRKAKADHCGLEVHSVIGNHDIWGWDRPRAGTAGSEPLFGKRWACDEFGRDLPYTSFDRGGWHVVLLDSVSPHPGKDERSYIGRLDEPQWEWLERDLAATPPTTHVLVVSHIPILSATPIAVAGPAAPQAAGLQVPGGRIHVDADRLQTLFARHRNVKACASGHMHLLEQLDFQGIRYLCNGAVCGAWWKGKNRDTDFGYALIDLFDDGTVERSYVPYGWTAAT